MSRLAVGIWTTLFLTAAAGLAFGQLAGDDVSAEDAREQRIMERFLSILEKNPRQGTALDRIYGYHVERGTLDAFVQELQDRANEDNDGTAWMVLGLFELQRGQDAAAVKAFQKAEETRNDDPLASYYYGRALVLVGRPDEAIEAFERSISREPQRADLLEVYEALGRVHQRAQRTEEALAVWDRLESHFPDDERVQLEIAELFVEEGQQEAAIKRYERLADSADDRYRKVNYALKAAGLKAQVGQKQQALDDFESLLDQLNPDHWLYREVRGQIEEVFLRSDDLAGLSRYYAEWLKKRPNDIGGMRRLSRSLAMQGRMQESREWLEKAVERAPSDADLRLALIRQLVDQDQHSQAADEYEALFEIDPTNPDYITEWGHVVLEDESLAEDDRKQQASQVWRKLLDGRADDPVRVAQVADLLRQAKLVDDAVELYQQAIDLAPESPQYREYLGEYLHTLKRSEEAVAVWKQMVAGANRTPRKLIRLAEVLAGFGYHDEALETMAEACEADVDFADRLAYAEMLRDNDRLEESFAQLERAAALAETEDEQQRLLAEQIANHSAAGSLAKEIESIRAELAQAEEPSAADWHRLAEFLRADRQLVEAAEAINQAKEIDERSIPVWTTSAEIYERLGRLAEAADSFRHLATIDRRYRTEHLTQVATLEMRLGRREQALEAAEQVVLAAPGNAEHYSFFAELCFRLGESDRGLDALRRVVRLNPSDQDALLNLATALAGQFRTDEAIELYWRVFENATELDVRIDVIDQMADLYLRTNHFDRLIERLQRFGTERDEEREMAICRAAAYQSASDFGSARLELEQLLSADERDVLLLRQLARLAEAESDFESAVDFQQRVNDISPSREGRMQLARFYIQSGETESAEDLWLQLVKDEKDPRHILRAVDSLIGGEKFEAAVEITRKLLQDAPGNWEAMYREGRALAELGRNDEAVARFREILSLTLEDSTKSTLSRNTRKNSATGSGAATRQVLTAAQRCPIETRTERYYYIRRAVGIDDAYYYGGTYRQWSPADFGQARMAALASLYMLAGPGEEPRAFVESVLDELLGDGAPSSRKLWDLYYFYTVMRESRDVYNVSRELSNSHESEACWAFLQSLPNRRGSSSSSSNQDSVPALPASDLEHVVQCYEMLRTSEPSWLDRQIVGSVVKELDRAGRDEQGTALYAQAVEAASSANSVKELIYVAAQRKDVDTALTLVDRLTEAETGESWYSRRRSTDSIGFSLSELIGGLASAGDYEGVLRVLRKDLETVKEVGPASGRWRTSVRMSTSSDTLRVYTYQGAKRTSINIDFPLENSFLGRSTIQVIRNAYDACKRGDVLSDLDKNLTDAAEACEGNDRAYEHLALAAIAWWEEDRPSAVEQLQKAQAAVPGNTELRIELARLQWRMQDYDQALAVVESTEPLDHVFMRHREVFALKLAVRLGDLERARQAAERLFGLRLDLQTQIQLSSQMHQLGMHEMAEVVLSRARRRAGSRTETLITLMEQYDGQGDSETATQIAHQLLRRAKPGLASSYNYQADQARQKAISLLSRSGHLETLIERTRSQLERASGSLQIHLQLADYLRAADKNEEAKEVYERIAEIRPDDARVRYQLAQELVRAGDREAAADHYLAAVRLEPRVLNREFYNVRNVFQQLKRIEDLVDVLLEVDLRRLSDNYWYMADLSRMLMQDDDKQEKGLKLFEHAWNSFTTRRPYLLSSMYEEKIWKQPQMYDYAREALIPTSSGGLDDPWAGLNRIFSYQQDGKVIGLITRVLQAATQQGREAELRKEVLEALETYPEWSGGKVLLAVMDARSQRTDEAGKLLQEFLEQQDEDAMPVQVRRIVAQEFEGVSGCEEIVVRLYESAVEDAMHEQHTEFYASPARRLAHLYKDDGRDADARKLLLQWMNRERDIDYYGNPDYAAYRQLEEKQTIGRQLMEMGFFLDVVQVSNQVLRDKATLQSAQRQHSWSRYEQQFQSQMDQALQKITAESLQATLEEMLQTSTRSEDTSRAQEVDLILVIQPANVADAEIVSLLESGIEAVAEDEETRGKVQKALARTGDGPGADLNSQIIRCLAALAFDDQKSTQTTLDAIEQSLQDRPLEELADGERANARQRAEAERYIALWLVARELFQHDTSLQVARRLEAAALEAARRQIEDDWYLAMLRELGQRAYEAEDRQQAQRVWAFMLEVILEDRRAELPGWLLHSARDAPSGDAVSQKAVRPAGMWLVGARPLQTLAASAIGAAQPAPLAQPAASSAADAATHRGVATLARFQKAMEIALLATRREMTELSLEAVRRSLAAGPPISESMSSNALSLGSSRSRNASSALNETEQITQTVNTELFKLAQFWQRATVPPQDIYDTLLDVVFPPGRPDEIFLYATPMQTQYSRNNSNNLTNVGNILIYWAQRARRTDDLAARLAERKQHPQAALPAQLLLTQLYLADGADEKVTELLGAINAAFRGESDGHLVSALIGVGKRARHRAEWRASAFELLDNAVGLLEQPQTRHVASNLVLELGRFALTVGDHEAGDRYIEQYRKLQEQSGGNADYVRYQQRQIAITLAREYLRAERIQAALENLAIFAETPSKGRYYGNWNLNGGGAALIDQLYARSPQERYELLADWTLPDEEPPRVRLFGDFFQREQPTGIFVPEHTSDHPASADGASATGLASTALVLIESARDAGRFDDLRRRVEGLSDEIANADVLKAFIAAANEDGQPARQLLEQFREDKKLERTEEEKREIRSEQMEHEQRLYELAWLCARSPGVQGVGRELLDELHNAMHASVRTRARTDLAAKDSHAEQDVTSSEVLSLRWWTPTDAGVRNYGGSFLDETSSWAAADGYLRPMSNSGGGSLLFRPPLTGTFDFSADVLLAEPWGGAIHYGGETFLIYSQRRTLYVSNSAGRQANVSVPFVRPGEFNRVKLQVRPDTLRLLVNEHLAHETKNAGATSPWLGLVVQPLSDVVFRNLKLEGIPEIPQSIALVAGDSLQGWKVGVYGDTIRPDQVGGNNSSVVSVRSSRFNAAEYDWSADDGEIYARRSRFVPEAEPVPAWLQYNRPLNAGDRLSFEFFYEPGLYEVHPTLGRTAFLLQSDGVKLHWLTWSDDRNWSGLPSDNVIDDPQHQQVAALPLLEGEWNRVDVSLQDGHAQFTLNGVDVYRCPADQAGGNDVGFFHYKDQTAARLRNIILSGGWSTELDQTELADLLTPSSPDRPGAIVLGRRLVGEEWIARDAGNVWFESNRQSPEERLETLRAWVLPAESPGIVRLYGDLAARRPPPALEGTAAASGETVGGLEEQCDVRVISPARLLLQTAAGLGRLDELVSLVQSRTEQSGSDKVSHTAVRALFALYGGSSDEAALHLDTLSRLAEELSADEESHELWPIILVALEAANRPEFKERAQALLTGIAESKTPDPINTTAANRLVQRLLAGLEISDAPLVSAADEQRWHNIAWSDAQARGTGLPTARWLSLKEGQFHLPGAVDGGLYYHSPLTGEFELHAVVPASSVGRVLFCHSGIGVGVTEDGKQARIWRGGTESKSELDPPLEMGDDSYPFGLQVTEDELVLHVGNREICRHKLAENRDPWLIVWASGGESANVSNLQLSGSPAVAEEIDLLAAPPNSGHWRDYYRARTYANGAPWKQESDLLVGRKSDLSAADHLQQLIQYHRPLLEDGTLEFEFYYVPGTEIAHPALDRMVFLLSQEGVRLHWVTDAEFAPQAIAPADTTELEPTTGSTPLTLIADEWNKVRLTLDNDHLALQLNDQEILTQQIDLPREQRKFGLFHYADEQARIRNVVYRGAWTLE